MVTGMSRILALVSRKYLSADRSRSAAIWRIARDDVIEQSRRVTAGDEVLVERGDVEQRRGVPNRVIFAVVRQLVRARDDVAGPAPPGLPFRQRARAGMERRGAQAHVTVGVSAGAKTTRTWSCTVIE